MSDNDQPGEDTGTVDEEGFTGLTGAVLDQVPAPKPVRRMAESIQRATGRAPEITRPGPASWQVSLTGNRVSVTVDFETRLGGKTKWSGSDLYVDGKPRPRVAGPAEFGVLWRKMEDTRQDRAARPELAPVPPPPGGVPVPAEIAQLCDQLTALLPDDTTVETGYRPGRWIVGVTVAPDTGLRFFFRRRTRRAGWDAYDLQVISGGRDVSAQAGNDLAAAVALLTSAPRPGGGPPDTGPGGTLSRGARDDGVATRKRVVIREYRPARPVARVGCLREIRPAR
jgi:hypothetical protein